MNVRGFFETWLVGFTCGIVIMAVGWIYRAAPMIHQAGYKEGQIDALSGKVRFELSQESVWRELPETTDER